MLGVGWILLLILIFSPVQFFLRRMELRRRWRMRGQAPFETPEAARAFTWHLAIDSVVFVAMVVMAVKLIEPLEQVTGWSPWILIPLIVAAAILIRGVAMRVICEVSPTLRRVEEQMRAADRQARSPE